MNRDYEQIQTLRRNWVPHQEDVVQGDPRQMALMEDGMDTPLARSPLTDRDEGVYFQRCGGGVRVIRKRITG